MQNMNNVNLKTINILNLVINGYRINEDQAIHLFLNADLLDLAIAATSVRNRFNHPKLVSYIIDYNINYTNICCINCTFCAFCRCDNEKDAYLINYNQLKEKLYTLKRNGGSSVLIQGGVNPSLNWEYYLKLIFFIKKFDVWIHGFSPIEIQMMSKINGCNLEQTIQELRNAGLDSIPGGGAEILSNRIRRYISPNKGDVNSWLEVMEVAHKFGIKTTATMMFGTVETIDERIEHLRLIRDQQDRALHRKNDGFYTAFAAWPFQQKNTIWENKISETTDVEYLRTIAIARIYLDNFSHIQSSWVTMGHQTGQLALNYGCDDMGSIMFEENVIKATGTNYQMSEENVKQLITDIGFKPWKRNVIYNKSDIEK